MVNEMLKVRTRQKEQAATLSHKHSHLMMASLILPFNWPVNALGFYHSTNPLARKSQSITLRSYWQDFPFTINALTPLAGHLIHHCLRFEPIGCGTASVVNSATPLVGWRGQRWERDQRGAPRHAHQHSQRPGPEELGEGEVEVQKVQILLQVCEQPQGEQPSPMW